VGITDPRIQVFRSHTNSYKELFYNTVRHSLAMSKLAYNKLYLPGFYKRTDPLSCEGSESDMYKL